jgi:Helix-turn-helix domain
MYTTKMDHSQIGFCRVHPRRIVPTMADHGPERLGHCAARRILPGETRSMNSQSSSTGGAAAQKPATSTFTLLTPQEVATKLKVSLSFLAKARMRGDGPPYVSVGRSIRYPETDLVQWMRSQRRLSTSE